MKPGLDRLMIYVVLVPAIIGATLLAIYGVIFLVELIYPTFRQVAYMNVPEKRYRVEVPKAPPFVDVESAENLPEMEREEARRRVENEYRRKYGEAYEVFLKKDVRKAKEQLGGDDYKEAWGSILKQYEEE